jgi:hemerythrin
LRRTKPCTKNLTGQVVELREKYLANKRTLTLEVMHFLKSWLADHIMATINSTPRS